MARKRRIEFAGALYHICARGNNRQAIFTDNTDREALLDGLAIAITRDGATLYAFCLMDNHFHLLLETSRVPLNRVMRGFLTKYARYFNKKYRRVGHLFQGRYRASLCEADGYRLESLRYIHLNPVRGGLVDKPEDWRWSSHRAYLGSVTMPFLSSDAILAEFGSNPTAARTAFGEFVLSGLEETPNSPIGLSLESRDKGGGILGSGRFHGVARKASAPPRRRADDKTMKRCRITDIIRAMAAEAGFDENLICGQSRQRNLAKTRSRILLATIKAGWPQSAAARAMRRSDAWASQIVKQHTFNSERRESDE